ncbi:TPA: carbon storage regulator [Stenotrophomonas maltophilia]
MSRNSPTSPAETGSVRAGAKVINRQEGELVQIGNSIEVVILKARDGRARLVISAPRNLEITAPKQ